MLLLASSVCGIFKWRQFEPEVVLLAVGWYLRFSLSYRDVEELIAERGVLVDHVTVWRWVLRYAPEMERRLRWRIKPTNDSLACGRDLHHPHPRVINTDKDAASPPAIAGLQAAGDLADNCQHRPVQYLNNGLGQDHRAIKRRVRASQHFRSFWGAWRTIAGYEAIHMMRKDQAP